MLISVIIPIYNVGPYLGPCIDSVLRSDYEDFELILIDDGSTDGCLDLCREYARRDSRVTVLTQENQGVSAARNRGLEVCRGEWVVFVDADDCISPDYLSLVAGAEDADLLLFDFAVHKDELTAAARPDTVFRYGREDMPGLAERVLAPRQLRRGGQVNFYSSNGKAFKKAIIDRYVLRFAPELSYGEDKLFNLDYTFRAENCVYLPVPVYFYETRPGSLSHSFRQDRLDNLIAWMEKRWTILNKYAPSTEEPVYKHFMLDCICYALTDFIFSPLNPKAPGEKHDLCVSFRKESICCQALKQNLWYSDLSRLILLSAFKLRLYRITALLCAVVHFRRVRRERKAASRAGNGGKR